MWSSDQVEVESNPTVPTSIRHLAWTLFTLINGFGFLLTLRFVFVLCTTTTLGRDLLCNANHLSPPPPAAAAAGDDQHATARRSVVVTSTAFHIYILSMSIGCLSFALGCSLQCFVNNIHGSYWVGHHAWTCHMMGIYHNIGVWMVLTNLWRMLIGMYERIVCEWTPKRSQMHARYWFLFNLCTGLVIVPIMGAISPMWLYGSGSFCFYRWNSPVMFGLFGSVIGLCLMTMPFIFCRISHTVDQVKRRLREVYHVSSATPPQHTHHPAGAHNTRSGNSHHAKLLRRFSFQFATLVVCWLPLPAAAIYEFSTSQPLPYPGDIVVAVLVSSYNIAFPLLTAHQFQLKLRCVCCCGKKQQLHVVETADTKVIVVSKGLGADAHTLGPDQCKVEDM